jgi:hypothetical protein
MTDDPFAPRCPFCCALLPEDDPSGDQHQCDSTPYPELDLGQVERWLDLVYPAGGREELLHVASPLSWAGRAFNRSAGQDVAVGDQLAAHVADLNRRGAAGIYLAACTLHPDAVGHIADGGRGRNSDAAWLYGVWSDIDIAGPGHKHDPAKYAGRDLPHDEATARAIVEASKLPQPTTWVHSGGGLYAWWLLEHPAPAQQHAELVKAWQAALGRGAEQLGLHYGTGVSDLARVMRLPGTINRKIPADPRPCRILTGDGPRYDIAGLHAAIEAAKPKEKPRQAPPAGAGDPFTSPGQQRHHQGDDTPLNAFEKATDWAEILAPHGWTLHRGDADGTRYWIRPGKDTAGHSMTTGHAGDRDRAYCFSDAAGLPVNQSMTKGYVYAALNFGGDMSAAAQHLYERGFGARANQASSGGLGGDSSPHSPPPHDPPEEEQPPVEHDQFWNTRPTLAAIRDTARERRVAPWAVLACVLATVSTRVGPHVVLPATVGSVASLNTFWALVGASGSGKDAALAVAQELLWLDDTVPTHEVGTGQGIDSAYTQPVKKGSPVQFCDTALFTITEIDTLAAHAAMGGSSIMSTLRKVYTGAALGSRYADRERRRPVKAHRYRAAVIAGVQPARSGVLLSDADAGTPQRWLFMPTNDPGEHHRPASSDQFTSPYADRIWQPYQYIAPDGDLSEDDLPVTVKRRIEMKICRAARDAIIANRDARLQAPLTAPDGDLTGHKLLTRLKVAALLALFDNARTEVNEQDWELAGTVTAVSDAAREVCTKALRRAVTKANIARANIEADRAEVIEDRTVKRMAKVLQRALVTAGGGWLTRTELRGKLNSRDRQYFEAAIARLVDAGMAEVELTEHRGGECYRAAQ